MLLTPPHPLMSSWSGLQVPVPAVESFGLSVSQNILLAFPQSQQGSQLFSNARRVPAQQLLVPVC